MLSQDPLGLGISYSKETCKDDEDSDSEWECENELERNAFDALIVDEED